MFIDDIKLFTANERELYPALKEVKLCLKDLNMSLGNDKCAVMTVKRGEMHHNQALQLHDTTKIRSSPGRPTLQVPWHPRTCTSRFKTHERRDSQRIPAKGVVILVIPTVRRSTRCKLQLPLLCQPWHTTCRLYTGLWTTWKSWIEIWEKSSTTQKQSTQRPQMSCMLYFPRTKGGRGLKSVEQVHKETKIKTALHMHRSTDPAVKAAAKADLIRMQKGRRSITRDANTFANEISVEISTNQDEEWEIKFESQDKSTHLARGLTVKNVLTRVRTEAAEHSIETQKWQGKLINNRLNDENIGLQCFDWLTNWEDCPSETIRDVEEVYQRLVPRRPIKLALN